MGDSAGDRDVAEGGDDADTPEEDEDVVPLQDEVQGAGAVPAQSVSIPAAVVSNTSRTCGRRTRTRDTWSSWRMCPADTCPSSGTRGPWRARCSSLPENYIGLEIYPILRNKAKNYRYAM